MRDVVILSSEFEIGLGGYETSRIAEELTAKGFLVHRVKPSATICGVIGEEAFVDFGIESSVDLANCSCVFVGKTRGAQEEICDIISYLSVAFPSVIILDSADYFSKNPLSKVPTLLKRSSRFRQPQSIVLNIACGSERVSQVVDKFDLKFPLVVKPISGSGGRQVEEVHSLTQLFSNREAGNGRYLVQEKVGIRTEFRVIVLNGKSIGCWRKEYKERSPDFRPLNASQGCNYFFESNERATALAEMCAREERLFVAGVDVVLSDDGEYFLLECNRSPAFEPAEKSSDLNIASAIVAEMSRVVGLNL